jgi:hypothetical protein
MSRESKQCVGHILRVCVRVLLCVAALLTTSSIFADSPPESASLVKACQYLWSAQAKDGGWHSGQYALLRSGQALTPFVLHTLLQVPESVFPRPEHAVDRALDFIRQHVDKEGALGHSDPDIVEYPVYSSAYALQCLAIAGGDSDLDLARRIQGFLEGAQFGPGNGFDPHMAAYGGWGFDKPKQPGEPGHMDLAHTRRALEALSAANRRWPKLPSGFRNATERAQFFLRVVQRHEEAISGARTLHAAQNASLTPPFDGGFYFSPIVLTANKGREEQDKRGTWYYRSYATATCDGLLSLLACGVPPSDKRVVKAVEWLESHDDISYSQGVPINPNEPWAEAIRFYHFAVRSEVYAALQSPGDWRARIRSAVAKRQAADGGFRNTESPLMKEDEPILCTTLATVGLAHCLDSPELLHPVKH